MVDKKYDFAKIEANIQEFWKRHPEIILRSIRDDPDKPIFSFLEGPPTANAPPALHHVECRVFKDLVNRYHFMKGFSVPRKGGWDCHGLPVEVQVEKKLGLETKKDVLSFGVNNFINECKTDVFNFIEDWNAMTDRMAFWCDLEKPYRTLDTPFMESVWWSLKELHKKNLLYKGYKVVPFCPRCETPLSSHEVALGYKDVEDDTAAAKFKVKGEDNLYLVAWTTTPWTLLSNLLLAVNNDVKYSYVKDGDDVVVLATDLLSKYFEEPEVIKEVSGKDLVGLEYEPLFTHHVGKVEGNPWRVVHEDYVTTEEGTGIVHEAPAFGEIDYESCKKHGAGFVNPVQRNGAFTLDIPEFAGRFVKDCDEDIIKMLEEQGKLLKAAKYMHSYPFCWRCKSPLLYYAMDSWFIRVSEYRDKLVENNQKINWFPNHIKDGRFGKWIAGAKDWALSRNKFWGTPLPVWVCESEECDHQHAIGSIAELKEKSGVEVDDLHIPTVDPITFECEKCKGTMKRTPEVIDCWYDSGSAPFAQYHYPFENKEMFERSFPYGFIAEAIDQTRGWFYTMHVIGTLLFDNIQYQNCAVAGLLCDDNGEKMSKSKGNIIKPMEMFDEVGVDAVRMVMASYGLGSNIKFGKSILSESIMPFFNTLWNSYYFAQSFVGTQHGDGSDHGELKLEDKWILSRLNSLVKTCSERMEQHEYNHVLSNIQDFVTNDFSRSYIKLVRDRTNDEDKELVHVFKTVMDVLVRLLAPIAPYTTEQIYQDFVRTDAREESVHLESWPEVGTIDEALEAHMETSRSLVQAILQSRDKAQIGTRWPMGEVLLVTEDENVKAAVETYGELIKQQTNVKKLSFVDSFDKVSYTGKLNYKGIGDEYGTATGDVLTKLKGVDEQDMVKGVLAGGYECDVESEGNTVKVKITESMFALEKHIDAPFTGADFNGGSLYIDTTLTPELEEEGYCREVVRRVQQLRKDAGLEKQDRVDLFIWSDSDLSANLKSMLEASAEKVGAAKLTHSTKMPEPNDYAHQKEDKIKKHRFCVLLNKL